MGKTRVAIVRTSNIAHLESKDLKTGNAVDAIRRATENWRHRLVVEYGVGRERIASFESVGLRPTVFRESDGPAR